MARGIEWNQQASADNAAASATRPAEAGARHVATKVFVSYSTTAPVTKLLTITTGGRLLYEGYIHAGQGSVDFGDGIRGDAGKDLVASLAASGAAGVLGKVNLFGYTE